LKSVTQSDWHSLLLIGIVKKNGIMMVDFAIATQRDEQMSRPMPFAALPFYASGRS
jgi:hypothetical protein